MSIVFSGIVSGADPETDSLISLLPGRVNAVVVIDVQKILATPMAKKENWKEKQEQQPLAADLSFPLNAKLAVRGLELYPEGRAVTESYNLLLLGRSVDVNRIAEAEGSKLELLAGKRIVMAPGKGFFIDFGKQRLGVFSPVYRQQVGSWIRENGSSEQTRLGGYLTESVKGSEAPLIMILDLMDVFGTEQVAGFLSNSQALASKSQEIRELATLLTAIQGIRMEVSIAEEAQGTLSVDFQKAVGPSQAESLKAILMEVLANTGYGFKEFQKAAPKANGKSLQLQAVLAKESLQDLVQLALVPTTKGTAEPVQSVTEVPASPQPVTPEKAPGKQPQQATFEYYRGVSRLINTAADRAQSDPENFPRLANLYESVSKRIDGFPITNVDANVLEFGASVASTSRALAASYRGASVNVDALNKSITYEVNTNPYQSLYPNNNAGYWGWGATTTVPGAFQVKSNKEDVRSRQVNAVTAEEPKRQQLSLMMKDEQQKVRRELSEKYNADPDAK